MKAVNLIPSEQRSGLGNVTGQSDGAAFIVLGTIAALAVMALLYGMASKQVSSRRGEAATITAKAQAAETRANQLAPYASFITMRDQRVAEVSQLVDTRFDWAHAFHEIGRVLPYDASLLTIDGTIGAPGATGSITAATAAAATASSGAVTSATPPGSVPTFTLTGCATNQSEVAQTLVRLRLIDGVTNVELQSSTKSTSTSTAGADACAKNDPAFTLTVTFAALPTPSAAKSGVAASTPASTTASTATPAGGAQ